MGVFDLLNSNKRKWMAVMGEKDVPHHWKYIISEFFIKDNISVEKYQQNSIVNDIVDQYFGLKSWCRSNELSMNPEPEPQCTHTFRNYFSEDRMNRGMDIPDWFYIAYPDVAIWVQDRFDKIEAEFSHRQKEFFSDEGINPKFFRILIERYKQSKGTLECVPLLAQASACAIVKIN